MRYAVVCFALAIGCGGGSNPSTGDDAGGSNTNPEAGTTAPDAPQTQGDFTLLISRSWTIAPGATDTYRCVRIQTTQDMWIAGFRALSPAGTHHTVLTISTDANAQLGEYNCSAGSLDNQMLYASGVGTDDLLFPSGVAMHIPAGTKINLNLHLFNVTDQTKNDTSGVMVKIIPQAQVQQEADMMFSGTAIISIPSDGQPHNAVGGCTTPTDWHVFTLWPHMHQTATHQKWTYQPPGGAVTPMLDDAYAFAEQKNYPIADTLMPKGTKIQTTCTYVNNTGTTIHFGDSSNAEMCFTGMYKYPAGGTLFQCAGL
jgi:copper type II ascorbate-dependent monooxygenase-like protein